MFKLYQTSALLKGLAVLLAVAGPASAHHTTDKCDFLRGPWQAHCEQLQVPDEASADSQGLIAPEITQSIDRVSTCGPRTYPDCPVHNGK